MTGRDPTLAVVIPTHNEEGHLPRLLDDLERLDPRHRVVVADGGSTDGTVRLARTWGAELVAGPRGRAVQLNMGARAAGDVDWLLFLHADSRIGPAALECALDHARLGVEAGAAFFRFRLDGDGWFWRFLEVGQRIREALYGLVYGDQGLLLSRAAFEAVGGYPVQPLMEDVEMVKRVQRRFGIRRLSATLRTSTRRYEEYGRWKGWLRNSALISLYLAGVAPERLVRWYGPTAGPIAPSRSATHATNDERARRLMVFAKAPEAGRVKTRLAASLGEAEAVRIYRAMGKRILDRVRGGEYRTVVYYHPPESLNLVQDWLGTESLEFRPQRGADLGERLDLAFREALDEAEAVCVIGMDSPRLTRGIVNQAFAALGRADVVFGPADDGGYYLLGLTAPRAELFRNIPWSTENVLARSLERVAALGLRHVCLQPLGDVDTAEDLARELEGEVGSGVW